MSEKDNQKQLLPEVEIATRGSMPKFIIHDYEQLVQRANAVGKYFDNFDGNEKQLKAAKRQLSRADRSLNNRRKDISKPIRKMLKGFKGNIDLVRDPIDHAKKSVNKKLDVYRNQHLERRQSHLKPAMHEICASRGLKDIPVPADALKASMTKKKRLDIMIGTADKARQSLILNESRDINGKAISPNGEILPHIMARKITFFGDKNQLQKLTKFIKKNQIHLNISDK